MHAEALTIAEAAALLGVTRARIHQLLAAGDLTGPDFAGSRAPKGAGRVWPDSAEARQRVGRHRSSRSPEREARETGLRDDVYRLKIALDVARDSLRAERTQTARVTDLLARTVAALSEQQQLAIRADELAEGYSTILTDLLGPTGLPSS